MMPTKTYKALATVTLSSTASSVTFSNIPGTYRDLILVLNQGTHVRYDEGRVNFNGDTAGNYSNVSMYGSGSSAGSQNVWTQWASLTYTTGGSDNTAIMQIMDYSATDKHKTCITRSNRVIQSAGGEGTQAWASRWASTSAITSIAITGQTGSYSAGTTFALYGVIA